MSEWWNQPSQPPEQSDAATAPVPPCPWCGAPGIDSAAKCHACGASLSESESIDGLAIPGVTVVDPDVSHKVSADAATASAGKAADTTREGSVRMGGTVGAIAGLMAAGAAPKAAEPVRVAESAPAVDPAPAEFPAEYEPAPERSLDGAPEPTPEPSPGGGYAAVYEAPGVQFAPEVTDGYQAEYEFAPAPAAEPAPAEFLAEYEPVSRVVPESVPERDADASADSAARSGPDRRGTDRCPWCSATAPAGATHCPSCNASLAERDSLGDVLIPGVTGVDPALVHRNDALRSVMAVPGAKLFPTLGFGLAMVASIQQQAERRAESKRPVGELGVPSAEALELAARLDQNRPSSLEPDPATGRDPEPAPIVDAWADTPWAGTVADATTPAGLAESGTPELATPESEPWEDPSLAAADAVVDPPATASYGNTTTPEVAGGQTIEPVPDKAGD